MKVARFFCMLLLVVSLAAVGCGSSSDGDSSSSGSGAVTTAFVKSGSVIAKTATGETISGVTGTVSNSKISITVPDSVSYPFIVEVPAGAKLAVGDGEVDLECPLSRVVASSAELSRIYVSAFSTIKAQAFVQASSLGQENAEEIGQAALDAVFDSLGLEIEGNIESLNPTSNADLELAQQALFLVLGVSDDGGLNGLQAKFEEKVLNDISTAGTAYTAKSFIDTFAGDKPAKTVKNAIDDNILEEKVRKAFADGQEAGAGKTGDEAKAQAGEVAVPDTAALVSLSANGASVVVAYTTTDEPSDEGFELFLTDLSGTNVYGAPHTFNATVDTLKIAYADANGATPAFTASKLEDEVLVSGNGIWVQIPANTESGDYVITAVSNEDPTLTCAVTVTILPEGTVSIESVEASKTPTASYVAFTHADSSIEVKSVIPSGAEGKLAATGTESAPSLGIDLEAVGTSSEDAYFDVQMKAPSGIVFFDDENEEMTQGQFTLTYKHDGTWAVTYEDDVDEISVTTGGVTFIDDINLRAKKDMPLGQQTLKIVVKQANTETVVANTLLPVYLLNSSSEDYIAEIGSLTYNAKALEIVTEESPELTEEFATTVTTWKQKALGAATPASITKPEKFVFTPSSNFKVSSDVAANIEVLSAAISFSAGDYTETFSNTSLNIGVGEGKNNYETISLDAYYEGAAEDGEDWVIPGAQPATIKYEAP